MKKQGRSIAPFIYLLVLLAVFSWALNAFGQKTNTIPYSQLVDLLEASERLGGIEQDMKRILKMQDALRSQMAELMIAFGDLKRYVSD